MKITKENPVFVRFFVLAAIFLIPLIGFAAEEEQELPDSGVLASASSLPPGDYEINAPWGGVNITEENVNPMIGSIKRAGSNQYEYTVTNKSEDKYSARLALEQKDKNGKTVKTAWSAVSLAAGQSRSGKLRVSPTTANVTMKLSSWKRKKKVLSEEELAEKITETKGELETLEGRLPVAKPVKAPEPEARPEKTSKRRRGLTEDML